MRGIYIHIPFCHQICNYCDFNKFFFENQPVDEYIETIGNELSVMKAAGQSFENVETVFLGGGTPTALSERQLSRLLEIIHEYLDVASLKEFSTEANPDELTAEKLTVLRGGGVNRLSVGVQSFDEELLKVIGRTHNADDPKRVIEEARRIGFEEISIDLIYGLPNQTMQQWKETLNAALALDLPHYSGYSLIVEPKTVFYNLMNKGKLPLVGQDAEAAMLEELMEQMEKAGRQQYEISNFSYPHSQSVHNKIYWENDEYLGIGAGAHGYVDGVRYANIAPLKKYMDKASAYERPVLSEHVVTPNEKMEEELFLGLRMMKGVSASEFEEKFGRPMQQVYGKVIDEWIAKDCLKWVGGRLSLTKKGVFFGNEVFQQFLLNS